MGKPLTPGSTFTVRIPNDIEPDVLKYLNDHTATNRNNKITEWLIAKVKELMQDSGDIISLHVPTELTQNTKSKLKESLNNLLLIMAGTETDSTGDNNKAPLISNDVLKSMKGLILDDE